MNIPDLSVPVQIVVDEKKLLDEIGWTDYHQDRDGDFHAEGGKFDVRGNLAGLVADRLAKFMEDEMRAVVREIITDEAKTRVAFIVGGVISDGIRKTNAYGEPTGETTTLRELIVEQAQKQLTRKVNSRGETDRYAGNGSIPYVQYVAQEAARAALKGELADATKAAVDQVKAKVTGLVAEELGAKIAQAVTRA